MLIDKIVTGMRIGQFVVWTVGSLQGVKLAPRSYVLVHFIIGDKKKVNLYVF